MNAFMPTVQYAPPQPRGNGVWHVTRYQDVQFALRDATLSVQRSPAPHPAPVHPRLETLYRRLRPSDPVADLRGHWLALNDPPEHTRLREIIRPIWTKHVQRMRPQLDGLVHAHIARLRQRATVDLIQEFASPLPTQITAALLGMPQDMPDAIWQGLVHAEVLSGVVPNPSHAEQKHAEMSIRYVRQVIQAKRTHPADDLLSELVAAQQSGAAITDAEVTALVLLLLITSYRTPYYFFGGALEVLLQARDPFESFRGSKQGATGAVEELLRLTTSADSTERIVAHESELGGVSFQRGDRLYLDLLAANHDPAQFSAPEQFDAARTPNPHVAFGSGAHICLGAGLARLEAESVFKILSEQTPHMKLIRATPRGTHWTQRYKPAELWVSV